MDDEEQFISGIFNYCDRWCERCEFTSRCRVFAMEQQMQLEDDPTPETFARNLENLFADTKDALLEKAREFEVEIEPISDEEYSKIRAREREFIKGEEITRLADKYAGDALSLLESRAEWLEESAVPDAMQGEVIEVLCWYQFFISAKVQRGLHGIFDLGGEEDRDELTDPQSDANGSIKISLIAMERSILAWTYLISPVNKTTVGPVIGLLENLRSLTEQKFPYARDFIRPGFDEIETVM